MIEFNFLIPIEDTIFLFSAALLLISAVLVIELRSHVYAAFFLEMVGLANAVLFALQGLALIAIFQLVVYVGATVTFILFSVLMFKEAKPVKPRFKLLDLLIGAGIAGLLAVGAFSIYKVSPTAGKPSLDVTLPEKIVSEYGLALFLVFFTLLTTLIEALVLARREVSS